jgi:hypothetical protein
MVGTELERQLAGLEAMASPALRERWAALVGIPACWREQVGCYMPKNYAS